MTVRTSVCYVALGVAVCVGGVFLWSVLTRPGASAEVAEVPVEPASGVQLPIDRTTETAPSTGCPIHFSNVPGNGGITFRHQTGTSPEKPFPAANGSGIAAVDFDRDGFQDLYFATGTPFPVDLSRRSPHNRIYRNRGMWQFDDVTQQTGLGHNGYTAGLAVADFDNDGFQDVFLCCFGPDVLFHNCGDGTFQRVQSGVEDPRWGTSATFLDFDQDGCLDLYVCNYGKWTLETNQYCGNREKNVRIYCSPHTLEPERGSLFRSLGNGQFEDVTESTGIAARLGRAQGVIAADFNHDGWTDVYIGNDLHANSLFINMGLGRFDDATELSGAGYDERGNMQAGMGVDVADINGDGNFDLFVTNFEEEPNTLYEHIADKVYRDATVSWGLAADSLPWVGWGCAIRDFDLDGADDIWVVNGHVDDNLKALGKDIPYAEPSLIWHHEQGRFRFLGTAVGDYFATPHTARALVVADLDNDGDWDGVAGHQDEVPSLLRNECRSPGAGGPRFLHLELVGTSANRSAIGATVTLKLNGQNRSQPVRGGGSYLSAPDTRLIYALPESAKGLEVEVRWPSGHSSRHSKLLESELQLIIEPSADPDGR